MKTSIHSIKGGGDNSSLKKSKSAFKPLIASSLALALGMSVANATPSITVYDPKGKSVVMGVASSQWVQEGGFTRFTSPPLGDPSGPAKAVPYLIVSFGSFGQVDKSFDTAIDGDNGFHLIVDGELKSSSQLDSTVTFNANEPMLVGKSLQEKGYLAVNYINDNLLGNLPTDWNDANKVRRFSLTITQTAQYNSRNTSLVGDIKLQAGDGKDKNIFQATLDGDMAGNIIVLQNTKIVNGTGYSYTDLNSTFAFNNNASLQGNIYTDKEHTSNYGGAGNNIFNFQTGGIYGSISADTLEPSNTTVSNTINFNTGGTPTSDVVNFIEGAVIAHSGAINTINFKRDNDAKIGSLLQENIADPFYENFGGGSNIVNFAGGTLTINQGILTNGTRGADGIKNKVALSKENAVLLIKSQGIVAKQKSDVANKSRQQINQIIFQKGGTLEVRGSDLVDSDSGFNFDGILARDGEKNDIQFSGTQNAAINVASEIRSKDKGVNSITFGGSGTNTLNALLNNLGGEISLYLSGTTTALKSIQNNGGTNNITFSSNDAKLTLQGSVNQITSITSNASSSNSAILELASSTANGTSIANRVSVDGNKGLSFNLQNGANITFTSGIEAKADGVLTFNLNGNNTVYGEVSNAGSTTINVGDGTNGANGVFVGSIDGNGTTNVVFKAGNAPKTLALRGATNLFNSIDATNAGTLILDGANSDSGVMARLADISGELTAKFNGVEGKGAELEISQGGKTLKAITFGANSTNNKLTLATGATTITDKVKVGNNNAITFALVDGSNLTLSGGMTSSGNSTISSAGDASVTLVGGGITDKEKAINLTNLDLQGGTTAQLTVKNAKADISNFNAKTLVLDGSTGAVDTTLHIFENNFDVEMKGEASKVATLNLNGGTIKSIQVSSGDTRDTEQNVINFASGTTTITDAINKTAVDAKRLTLNLNGGNLILSSNIDVTNDSGTGKVDVSIENATLTLNGVANKVDSLSGNGGTIDFVGTNTKASTRASSARKTLTTNTFSGNLNAVVFVSKDKADQIIIDDTASATNKGTLTISAQGDINEILSITQDNGVVVAKVGSNSNIKVQGGDSVIDGVVLDLVVDPDKSGNGDYLIGKTITKGIDRSIQEVANTALTVNYDLFLANFNSLNKRMGELRDNPHSQGVWARVFGGAMSSDFGSGSKTEYVTAQAGYDYSLTLGNVNNYMGIAIAYGKSWTKANEGVGLTTSSLSNIDSNMIEVGIYNSYVMDSGWYNDTIFKFDYIMSDFTLNAGSNTAENNTNNFAMVLSDEFGYRYKFAENEKGNWYIDPQVEVAFGYFNQSDFNHVLNTQSNIVMKATQDNILNLRTRAGMSLGKKFNTAKGFATLYVGAFYEYDYIEGGNTEATLSSGISGNQLNNLESNGRAIVNVGSNIELTEGVRMYIDVEKSFGDKQRTDMQFNFGARYSFGEKTPTISYQEQQKKRVAPLKVEDKQEATQESKTEASANTEVKQ